MKFVFVLDGLEPLVPVVTVGRAILLIVFDTSEPLRAIARHMVLMPCPVLDVQEHIKRLCPQLQAGQSKERERTVTPINSTASLNIIIEDSLRIPE